MHLHADDLDFVSGPFDASHRYFEPFRIAASQAASRLVSAVVSELLAHEVRTGARQRARRTADVETFRRTVEALLLDAVHAESVEPSSWIRTTFSNRHLACGISRYRAPAQGTTLPAVARALDAAGWLEIAPGHHNHPFCPAVPNAMTRLRAGRTLLDAMRTQRLGIADVKVCEGKETVILRGKAVRRPNRPSCVTPQVDYDDTPETMRMRAELSTLNAALAAADIVIEARADDDHPPDVTKRRLYRVFNDGSFGRGGRLYGGFWIHCAKSHRSALRIDGEPVVELDYVHMALGQLYALQGLPAPIVDGYVVEGLEAHRAGVKTLMLSMISKAVRPERYPANVRELFPPTMLFCDALSRIEARHAPVLPLFYRQVGLDLMRQESDIMVEVLLALLSEGITALPIHDALLVGASNQAHAEAVMLCVYARRTGQQGKVKATSLDPRTFQAHHLPQVPHGGPCRGELERGLVGQALQDH